MARGAFWRALIALGAWYGSEAAAQDFGSLEGGVNEVRGTANLRVPIVVPPGPAGHTPQVALVYSTEKVTGGAGWVGVGWSAAGTSAIERDRKFGVPHDYNTTCGSSYCYRDDFVLDGTDLLCENSTCTGGGYKTQVDDGREITYLGATAGWRVRDREGRTLLYGATSATRIVNPKNGQVFSWLLESVTDVSGNWIQYAYAAGTGVLYPSEITYAQSGAAANRRVKFLRMTRPDVALDYTAGFRQQVDQRLSQIEVRAGAGSGSLVTRYDLVHVQTADSNRSLLASVQRFGADGTSSLPPWEFDYQTSSHSFGPLVQYQSGLGSVGLPVAFSSGGTVSSGSLDLNGDPLPDYLHRDDGPNNLPPGGPGTQWIPNLGLPVLDPNAVPPGPGYLHGYQLWSSSNFEVVQNFGGETARQLVDVDGDRYVDALDRGNDAISPFPVTCSWSAKRGGPSGFSETVTPWVGVPAYPDTSYPPPLAPCGISFTDHVPPGFTRVGFIDLTGDGRPDRLLSIKPNGQTPWQLHVAVNLGFDSGAGVLRFTGLRDWPNPSASLIEGQFFEGPLVLDVNGDGLPDHVWRSTGVWSVAYNFGGGFEAAVPVTGPFFNSLRDKIATGGYVSAYVDVMDINGDGLADRLEAPLNEAPRVDVWFGTGTGFKSSPIRWAPGGGSWAVSGGHPLWRAPSSSGSFSAVELRDLNGDGLLDRAAVHLRPTTAGQVTFNSGPYPDVMSAASSPLGAVLQLEYGAAASQPNAQGTTANGNLPMVRWVVTKTTRSDGRVGTPQIVDTYLYRNAGYDRAEREFRGFGEVVQSSLLTGGAVESTTTATFQTDRACGGQLATRSIAGGGLTYAQESHTYLTTTPQPAGVDPTRQWLACLPNESLITAVEGGSGPARTHKTKREYGTPINPLYDLTVLREYGEWNVSTGQDVAGDERFTFYEYAAKTDANYYVVSRPTRVEVQNGAGAQASLTQLFYDGNTNTNAVRGRVTAIEGWLNTPAPARWVRQATLTYDTFGNVSTRTGPLATYDADGFQEQTVFDTPYASFPIQTREGSDTTAPLVTTIAYGGCLDGVAPPEALGLPCTVTSPQGAVTAFRYDPLARLDKLQRPSGLKEIVGYTLPVPSGPAETLVQRTLDFTAAVPDLVFRQYLDGFGRTYRQESPGKATETIVTKRTFDSRGRTATESQPHFSTNPAPLQRVLGYDPLGRVKSVLDFDASTQRVLAYKPWEVVEETYFGAVQASNRKQHEESGFDGLGRLKEVRSFPDAVGLGSSFKITATYDAADRLLSVADPVAASGSPSSFCGAHAMGTACPTQIHTTQVVWDVLGRKLQIQDPDAGQWTYEYFDSGRLKKQTNGSGQSLEWSYDSLERMIQQTVNPTGNGSASASFVYGTTPGPDYGLLVSVTASTNYAYARDAAGRLASLTQTTPTSTGTFHGVRTWSYDELDRVSSYVFPGGTSIQNLYDGLRLVRIESGHLTTVPLAAASYDALGRPVDLDLGSSLSGPPTPRATLDYEYTDPGARLSRILARRQPDAGAQTVMDLAYEFDGLGRLTDQEGSFNGQNVDRSFGYDGLGRLTQATGPWQASPPGTNVAWSFTYDPLGNLRTLTGPSYMRTWSYGHASKPRFLSRFVESTDPVTELMQPDAGGNLAEVNRGGAVTSYAWNAQNRLHSGAGGTLSYDAFARRVELHQPGPNETSVIFVGDDFEYNTTLNQANLHFFVGGQRIASYATYPLFLEAGSTWGRFGERVGPPLAGFALLLGLAGLAALARRRPAPAWLGASGVGLLGAGLVLLPIPVSALGSGTPFPLGSHGEQGGVFYLTDHLGSTRAVVNLNGAQLESFDYDPFGRTIAHTGEMNLKHRFTGQPIHEPQYASADPLYNYGARFYQPKWGRFVSADMLVEGLSSQGMNRYAYVGNQPTSRTDPTGNLFSFSWTMSQIGSSFSSFAPGGGVTDIIGGILERRGRGRSRYAWDERPLQGSSSSGGRIILAGVFAVDLSGLLRGLLGGRSPGGERAGPPPLGPGTVFGTVDEAVVDALLYAHFKVSANPQFERGGGISAVDGGFTYGEPLIGDEYGVRPPLGRSDVASFHTHPRTGDLEIDLANETFSKPDARAVANDPLGRPSYVLTPTLAIRRLTLTGRQFQVRTVRGPKLPGEP